MIMYNTLTVKLDETAPLLHRRTSVNSPIVDTDLAIHQSAVFIKDGIHYRSIHHKIDQ